MIIGLVLLVVVVVKPLAATLTVRLLGEPWATAVPIGAAFSQVGEFSFILGTVALSLGLINATGWNALVAASIVSIALNPYVYSWARRRAIAISGEQVALKSARHPTVNPNRGILVGFGPVGQIVHRLLIDRSTEISVVDLNLDTVRRLRKEGHHAIYGDVRQPGTLVEAGIETVGALILSANVEHAAEIIKHAIELNPGLRVLARCTHLREAPALRLAGAALVAAGEAEVGVALAEAVTAADQMTCGDAAEHREEIRRHLYEGTEAKLVRHSSADQQATH